MKKKFLHFSLIAMLIAINFNSFAQEVSVSFQNLTDAYNFEMPDELRKVMIKANASVTDPDDLGYTIESVVFELDGQTITGTLINNVYYAKWKPSSYGIKNLKVTATDNNGTSSTDELDITFIKKRTYYEVPTFDGEIVSFGSTARTIKKVVQLPQGIGAYNQLSAKLIVGCPNDKEEDCDPWDRRANIDVRGPDGNWIQLIRYMTPYGVACNHDFDLTQYISVLQGEVEFRVFIDTWAKGWKIDLDFTYNNEAPEYLYSHVDRIWDGDFSFGNISNLKPVPVKNFGFPIGAEASTLKLSTTGHGWGANNSGNAAEFYETTHHIWVDGTETFDQHLWNICNPNPDDCTGQKGTWYHPRAGWCPGAIAPTQDYDLSSFIENGTIDLEYIFDQDYKDFCHPGNPDCVSGTTCTDCNGDTQPLYMVDVHVVSYSNHPMHPGNDNFPGVTVTKEIQISEFSISPNPTTGVFSVEIDDNNWIKNVKVISIAGKEVLSIDASNTLNKKVKIDLTGQEEGVYLVQITNSKGGVSTQKVILD